MSRKEPIKFNEFIALVPEEQPIRLTFDGLSVEGTQEAISCITNSHVNTMHVVEVSAEADVLKVWVKDYETA